MKVKSEREVAQSCLTPTRLLHPWDFPGKSTGVGCHCLLCKMGTIKDKNGRDLADTEEIKKKWKEYMEELYKKDLYELDY